MKNFNSFEQQIYHFIANRNNNPEPTVTELLDFWEHFDLTYNTNHYKILLTLGSPDAERYSEEGLARQVNVASRTLLRYRKLYLHSYLSFCKHNGVSPLLPPE